MVINIIHVVDGVQIDKKYEQKQNTTKIHPK